MEKPDFRAEILPLRDAMYRLALRVMGRQSEAEDVVQEAMLRIWTQRQAWDTIGNIKAYCMAAVRNMAIDKAKATNKHRAQIPLDGIALADREQADHSVRVSDAERLVAEAIDRLPEVQRSILQLREAEEMSYQEIAQTLGLTMSQVKVYLMRARQKLKEHLKDELPIY